MSRVVTLFALLAFVGMVVATYPEHGSEGQIVVRNLMGKSIIVEVDLYDTVATVKAKLEQKEGIAANVQTILFKRQPLDDERTLISYGIGYDSVLHVDS